MVTEGGRAGCQPEGAAAVEGTRADLDTRVRDVNRGERRAIAEGTRANLRHRGRDGDRLE